MTKHPPAGCRSARRRSAFGCVLAAALVLFADAGWSQQTGLCQDEARAAIRMSNGQPIPAPLQGPAQTARDAYLDLCHFVLEHPFLDDQAERRLAELKARWRQAAADWSQAERAHLESAEPAGAEQGAPATGAPGGFYGEHVGDAIQMDVPFGEEEPGGGDAAGQQETSTESWPEIEGVLEGTRSDGRTGSARASWKRPPGAARAEGVTLTISGQVLAEDGSPAADATVRAGRAGQASTDGAGRYRLVVRALGHRDQAVQASDLTLHPAQPCLRVLTPRVDLAPGGPRGRLRFVNDCLDRGIDVSMVLPAPFSPGGVLSVASQDVDERSGDSWGATADGSSSFSLGPSVGAWVDLTCRRPGGADANITLTEAGQPPQRARVVCAGGPSAPTPTTTGVNVLSVASQQVQALSTLLSGVQSSPHLDGQAARQKMERLEKQQAALRAEADQARAEAEAMELLVEAQDLLHDLVAASTLDAFDQGQGLQALRPGGPPISVATPPERAEIVALGRDALALVGSSSMIEGISGTSEPGGAVGVDLALSDGTVTVINDLQDVCRRAKAGATAWLKGVTEQGFYKLVEEAHGVGEIFLGWEPSTISFDDGEVEIWSGFTAYEVARDAETGTTAVTVFDGHVRVRPRAPGAEVTTVGPGTRAVVDRGGVSTRRLSDIELRRAARLTRRILGGLASSAPAAPPPAGTVSGAARTFEAHEIGLVDVDVYEYAYRNWNNANWGSEPNVFVGSRADGLEGTRRRTYIRFDVSRFADDRPDLLRFLLRLHGSAMSDGAATVMVHPVLEPWEEGDGVYHSGQSEPDARPGTISWTNQPRFDPDFISDTARVESARNEPFTLDVTALVYEWLSGSHPNYGLVLVGKGEGATSYKIVIPSSESSAVEQRPELVVIPK